MLAELFLERLQHDGVLGETEGMGPLGCDGNNGTVANLDFFLCPILLQVELVFEFHDQSVLLELPAKPTED